MLRSGRTIQSISREELVTNGSATNRYRQSINVKRIDAAIECGCHRDNDCTRWHEASRKLADSLHPRTIVVAGRRNHTLIHVCHNVVVDDCHGTIGAIAEVKFRNNLEIRDRESELRRKRVGGRQKEPIVGAIVLPPTVEQGDNVVAVVGESPVERYENDRLSCHATSRSLHELHHLGVREIETRVCRLGGSNCCNSCLVPGTCQRTIGPNAGAICLCVADRRKRAACQVEDKSGVKEIA